LVWVTVVLVFSKRTSVMPVPETAAGVVVPPVVGGTVVVIGPVRVPGREVLREVLRDAAV
jgi:hypothetical protein